MVSRDAEGSSKGSTTPSPMLKVKSASTVGASDVIIAPAKPYRREIHFR